ncbi:bis(5'-nucleosyl)-tetraphosphatase [Blastopirellula marina]|uniref:Bis(5'-nucleosyl)-tetraphosphatase [asymmetrical] n=1 Tax=Blastopirellula marina DSM 3645 TaxID=314230 RepID=A3ZZM8_9BACT|nr:bis(5'-nucleosyl)-tetraphosphatase [Blastopirellula marina]EAQ78004.1 probable MutT-family protein [Blastopirellula marina DSM 3645]
MQDANADLPETKACGFLIVKGDPIESFLLMRHKDRWDLPKGHVDPGEDEMTCALRELEEETGITSRDIAVDPNFRYALQYVVNYKKRMGGVTALKTSVYFLATLTNEVQLKLTEHQGSEWFAWNPPHGIQEQTIDPLLAAVAQHVSA